LQQPVDLRSLLDWAVVPDGKTRIIHLEAGQDRQHRENPETRMLVFESSPPAASFRDLFLRNYAAVRDRCASFGQPGLAVAAVDQFSGRLAGILCIAAKIGTANSAIVGRHSMTDLYLDGDASLSLRHLVVVVSPLDLTSGEVRFRVIDLRTQAAFQDEHGRRFEGLVAEGPLFIRCGNYVLFCLPTGDPTGWPEGGEDAWACIPERVYLEAAEAEPDRWRRKRRVRHRNERDAISGIERRAAITLVQGELGPVRAQTRLLGEGEQPLGVLRLRVGNVVHSVLVGGRSIHRGILLGRYERCDVDGSKLLTSESISRVHLLVVEVNDRVYAIDTASTNGTWTAEDDREVRIAALDPGTELCLGNDLAYLRWCPE
jgi:hypothetical protein